MSVLCTPVSGLLSVGVVDGVSQTKRKRAGQDRRSQVASGEECDVFAQPLPLALGKTMVGSRTSSRLYVVVGAPAALTAYLLPLRLIPAQGASPTWWP